MVFCQTASKRAAAVGFTAGLDRQTGRLSGRLGLHDAAPWAPSVDLAITGGSLHRTAANRHDFRRYRASCAQKNDLKPWQRQEWCIPSVSPDYVWHLEDVLDLYAETDDPRYPQVCFDESPVQLTSETRHPLPARPGQPARYDSEYKRALWHLAE